MLVLQEGWVELLSSQEVHEEEKGAGLVPNHHQEMRVPRMAIFRPNSGHVQDFVMAARQRTLHQYDLILKVDRNYK